MPTLLDDIEERHEGAEPRVLTADVQAVLQRVIRPGGDAGESVTLIAEKADISTRTVYRVLQRSSDTISLAQADNICRACDVHPRQAGIRLVWSDGAITDYSALRGVAEN